MMTRSSRLRLARRPPMAPPPPELFDDAIAEILLRLPPDDPACLIRASLVCKLWRRILSESTFPNRYRDFHRTPPLLGLICSNTFCHASKASHFVPITTRILPFFLEPGFGCRALDCRHGRILFDLVGGKRGSLAVWDPVTGDHKLLADPDLNSLCRSAVVLCAVAGCDHHGCHGGPFVVVLVCTTPINEGTKKVTRAWVYSSRTAAWRAPASLLRLKGSIAYAKRGAIVGHQIYFLLTDNRILKYDLGKHSLMTICLPGIYNNCHLGTLMTMDDSSSLGFAVIKDLTLHLWARKVNPYGFMTWVQDRVVLLNNLIPTTPRTGYSSSMNVIGFAEGVDFLLLGDAASGFMFELKSGHFKKLSNPEYHYYDVFPYLSLYIPDFTSHKSPLPVEAN